MNFHSFLPPGDSFSWTKVHYFATGLSQLLKCWLKSRRKEVASDLTVNQAEISVVLDIVKAIADSDVFIEEHE